MRLTTLNVALFALVLACDPTTDPDISRVTPAELPGTESERPAYLSEPTLAPEAASLAPAPDPCASAYNGLLTRRAVAAPHGFVRHRGMEKQRCVLAFLVDSSVSQTYPGGFDYTVGYELRVRIHPLGGPQTNLGTVAVLPTQWFTVVAAPDERLVVAYSKYDGIGYSSISGAVWNGTGWSITSLGGGSGLGGEVLTVNSAGDPELSWSVDGTPSLEGPGTYKAVLVGREWTISRQ